NALSPLEPRGPLLEKGARTFLVVLAAEGLNAQGPELIAVRIRDALEDGLDLRLRSTHRQRRVRGHRAEVVVRVRFELRGRHEALDESEPGRLGRFYRPRRVENVLRVRGPHQVDELMHGVQPVDDAEPGGGDAELGTAGREAKVAGHGDGHRAAHAE